MEVLLVIWTLCAVLCAAVASGKGHGGCLWGLMGLIFGVFALLIILVMPANRPPAPVLVTVKNDPPPAPPQPRVARKEKTCPDCAEAVLADAKVCRHCGYRFDGTGDVRAIPAPQAEPAYQREHLASVTVLKAVVVAAEPVAPAHVTAISDFVAHREGWRDMPSHQAAELRRWIGSVPNDTDALRAALNRLLEASPRVRDATLDAMEAILSGSRSGNVERQSKFAEHLRQILG